MGFLYVFVRNFALMFVFGRAGCLFYVKTELSRLKLAGNLGCFRLVWVERCLLNGRFGVRSRCGGKAAPCFFFSLLPIGHWPVPLAGRSFINKEFVNLLHWLIRYW